MSLPAAHDLFAALEATWPPRTSHRAGPWVIRDGAGGGSRVSAATTAGPVGPGNLPLLVAEMAALGQPGIVQVRAGQDDLDALLAGQGWTVADPTRLLAVALVAADLPPPGAEVRVAWPPTAAQDRMWAAEGIGAARRSVMDRVAGPRGAVAAGPAGAPQGAALVALDGGIAMVHAMAVVPAARRQGIARQMLACAADWAAGQGARTLALAVTAANGPARALYGGAGFADVTGYHYRMAPGA